jgi:uncharacterized membrane protein YuzA (DUF378 family)
MATMTAPTNERRHMGERRSAMTTAGSTASSRMTAVDWIAMTLLIVGGLNWGLVGLFNVDLVATLFGQQSAMSRLVYVVVGICALYSIYTSMKMSRSPAR